jgi:hypothetical protein
MGRVLRVRDRASGEEVALKLLHPGIPEEARRRFLREAEVLGRLDHPGILRSRDAGELKDGTPYLVTELLAGGSLDQCGPLEDPLSAMRQVGEALQAAHDAGVLHRDVKPANIVREPGGRAVLIDMGLALDQDLTRLTATGNLVGTLGTMAPELFRGVAPSPSSDWYSWAVSIFWLVEGHSPFDGEVVMAVARGAPLPRPTYRNIVADTPLWRALEALLVVDPERRPASWSEIEAILDGREAEDTATTQVTPLAEVSKTSSIETTAPHSLPARTGVPPLAWVGLGLVAATATYLLVPRFQGAPPPRPIQVEEEVTAPRPAMELLRQRAAKVQRLVVVSPWDDPEPRLARQLAPPLADPIVPLVWQRYLGSLQDWLATGPDLADPTTRVLYRQEVLRIPKTLFRAYKHMLENLDLVDEDVAAGARERKIELEDATLEWLAGLPPEVARSDALRVLRWRWLVHFAEADLAEEFRVVREHLLPGAADHPLRQEILGSARNLLKTLRATFLLTCEERGAGLLGLVQELEASRSDLSRPFWRASRRDVEKILRGLPCPAPALPDGRSIEQVLAAWSE